MPPHACSGAPSLKPESVLFPGYFPLTPPLTEPQLDAAHQVADGKELRNRLQMPEPSGKASVASS